MQAAIKATVDKERSSGDQEKYEVMSPEKTLEIVMKLEGAKVNF